MQFSVSDFGLYEIQKLLFHLFFYVISKWQTVDIGYRNSKDRKCASK